MDAPTSPHSPPPASGSGAGRGGGGADAGSSGNAAAEAAAASGGEVGGYSCLFDSEALDAMWSPLPYDAAGDFGEAEEAAPGAGEGLWDGASWRSLGVVAGEGGGGGFEGPIESPRPVVAAGGGAAEEAAASPGSAGSPCSVGVNSFLVEIPEAVLSPAPTSPPALDSEMRDAEAAPEDGGVGLGNPSSPDSPGTAPGGSNSVLPASTPNSTLPSLLIVSGDKMASEAAPAIGLWNGALGDSAVSSSGTVENFESLPTSPFLSGDYMDVEAAPASGLGNCASPDSPIISSESVETLDSLPDLTTRSDYAMARLSLASFTSEVANAVESSCSKNTSKIGGSSSNASPKIELMSAMEKVVSSEQKGASFPTSENCLAVLEQQESGGDSSLGNVRSPVPSQVLPVQTFASLAANSGPEATVPSSGDLGTYTVQGLPSLSNTQSSPSKKESKVGVQIVPVFDSEVCSSPRVVEALQVVNGASLEQKGAPVLPRRMTRLASKMCSMNSDRTDSDFSALSLSASVAITLPVAKRTASVLEETSRVTPKKPRLAYDECFPNLESTKVESGELCGSVRVVEVSSVANEMSKEQNGTFYRPLRSSKLSLKKCSTNLKRAESDNGMPHQLPRVTVTPPVVNVVSSEQILASSRPTKKPKLALDDGLVNSQRVESAGGPRFFVGEQVPPEEARRRWPHHYVEKMSASNDVEKGKRRDPRTLANNDEEDELVLDVKCHYLQANINGSILGIGDCAHVEAPEGKPEYVGRILEFFETNDGEDYFTVQWFFRAEDTVMEEQAQCHDRKRLFYSDLKNDNLLDCLVSKVTVVQVPPSVDRKPKSIPSCFYYYYDMKYSVDYTTFSTMETGCSGDISDMPQSSCSSIDSINNTKRKVYLNKKHDSQESEKTELDLLDLYCGCGGMSTGLCFGARSAGVNLVARWAVDSDEAACHSLRLNHPETQVRNESANDFLELLKEWQKLCKKYVKHGEVKRYASNLRYSRKETLDCSTVPPGEFEVLKVVDICFGDPSNTGKRGLKFKVRWKGYNPNDDTWEPIEGLSNCKDAIQDFVIEGHKRKILPLPGDADVICGGPPCQGISGYNRFRNFDAPLDDERNKQIIVFMDIVQFLKPKYVFMENVVDILKFAKATLARYAVSRLVAMNYQAKLGILAAGCYGLPQFRMRVFVLGSHPSKKLPPFPLPTHDVILKYGSPVAFERNLVAYEEGAPRQLERALVLEDVLSDLPQVTNKEVRDEMPHVKDPQTEFQRYLRTSNIEMLRSKARGSSVFNSKLYDHRPLPLSEDDYLRVSQIPKKKGANFRDLPGVIIGPDNIARLDPTMERILLPSGSPMVPNYALSCWDGKSVRPFARLWWDEVVATVLTFPNSHCQALLHPEQDRMLTIRECARLQGFPDCYRFCGTVKDRYRQIGNAVAIPVGRALGYAMALTYLKKTGDEPLVTLPPKFAFSYDTEDLSSSYTEAKN